ncbi:AAA family ATPase [Nocardiopsis sp. NPDC050513]|uniref:AAA family ATPase n=1 Tax=Nocardiopsis sp. NPDC050513 TaxID=3364338 RepID=UPI0037BA4842
MQDNRFSLTRVQLRHYRSIAKADISLGPLLFLVGPNGSGKSNVLDALRLLSEALQTTLDHALRTRGGAAEVRRRSTGHPNHFGINLEFRGPASSGKYRFEVGAVQGGGFKVTREECHVHTTGVGDARRGSFKVHNGKLIESSEPVMPPASEKRLYLVSASGLDIFQPVFEGLAGINVFSLNPDAMREPQAPDSGEFLRRDGANIASVMHRLDQVARSRIEEYLRNIVPGMRGVSRKDLGNWETLEFTQEVPGARDPWRFPAQSVSDGTLRALGVLVSLFADSGDTLSTIGIEEPESALHPAASGVLLDALRDASARRQVIVTSHSPDLLDRDDFELEQLCAVRSVGGETRIGPLDEAGALAMREHLYTPGELLRTDQLLPETAQLSLPLEGA